MSAAESGADRARVEAVRATLEHYARVAEADAALCLRNSQHAGEWRARDIRADAETFTQHAAALREAATWAPPASASATREALAQLVEAVEGLKLAPVNGEWPNDEQRAVAFSLGYARAALRAAPPGDEGLRAALVNTQRVAQTGIEKGDRQGAAFWRMTLQSIRDGIGDTLTGRIT